ncbi:hypothetical protein ACQY0O_003547 [Thecaphora frezii]
MVDAHPEARRGSVLSNLEHHPSHPAMAAGSPEGQGSGSSRRSPSDDSYGLPPNERREGLIKQENGAAAEGLKATHSIAHGSSAKAKDGEPETKKRKRSQRACVRCRGQKLKCDGVFPCGRCLKLKLACKEPVDPSAGISSSSSAQAMALGSNSGSSGSGGNGSNAADAGAASMRGSQTTSRHILPSPSSQRRQHHHLYHSNPGPSGAATSGGAPPSSSSSAGFVTASGVPAASVHARTSSGAQSYHPQYHHSSNVNGPLNHVSNAPPPRSSGLALSWDDVSPVDFLRRLERLESTMEHLAQRVDRESSISWHDLSPSDVLVRFERLESTMERIAHNLGRGSPPSWSDERDRYAGPPDQQQERYRRQPPHGQATSYATSGANGPSPLSLIQSTGPPSANGATKGPETGGAASQHAHDARRPHRTTTPDDSELEIDELAQDGQSEMGPCSVEHTPRNGRYAGLHGPSPSHAGERHAEVRSSESNQEAMRSSGGAGGDVRETYDPIRGDIATRTGDKAAATRHSPVMDRRVHLSTGTGRLPRLEAGGMDRWHPDQRPGVAAYSDRGARDARSQPWQRAGYAE